MNIIQELRNVEEKYKNSQTAFAEVRISDMAFDCRKEIEKLRGDKERLQRVIEENEPCWACEKEYECEYSNTRGCSICEFVFDVGIYI